MLDPSGCCLCLRGSSYLLSLAGAPVFHVLKAHFSLDGMRNGSEIAGEQEGNGFQACYCIALGLFCILRRKP
eukprot:646778-Amphidinium_carterae.1